MGVRVHYVITDSGIGGSEKILLNLLEKLDRSRIEISGITVLKKKREMAESWVRAGAQVEALDMGYLPTPSVFWRLQKRLRGAQVDLVHAFLYHSVQLCRLARFLGGSFRLLSSPRVNYRFAPRWALTVDRGLRKLDDCAACESQATKTFLTDRLRYPAEKVTVIPNGVDSKAFQFNIRAREELRSELGVLDNELLVGSLGRLHWQKGYDLLIDALTLLRNSPVKFQAVVFGEGPDRQFLERRARLAKAPIRFLSSRQDPIRMLSALDIFVQSSRYEGMSNALLEAMSAGRPCVATSVDGTLEVIQDGKTGLLVKPEDPLALSVGIGFFLERSDLRKSLGEAARLAAETFSIDEMVARFSSLYLSLAKS